MVDDPMKRLEDHGREPAPAIDSAFADRLESHLRVEHVAQARTRRRLPALLPRVGVAAAVAVVVVLGAVAVAGRDPVVPVAVVDGQTPVADSPAPPAVGDGERGALDGADPTVTPTVTVEPTAPAATATVASEAPPLPTSAAQTPAPPITTAEPAPSVAQPTVPPPPRATTTNEPPPTTQPTPSSTAIPRPTPAPEATRPVPRPTPSPTSTVVPTPTSTPTVPAEPAAIDLVCRVRAVGDTAGIVCEWNAPVTDRTVAQYEIRRSRNGSDVVVASRQRANAPTTYVDRDVASGDTLAYLVRGLDGDGQVIAASIRQVVVMPAGG